MALVHTPICDFGWEAPSFQLYGIDGTSHDLASICGENGTLLMFICNHCPYVKAVITRLVEDVKSLQSEGFGVAAIMPNAIELVEADSSHNMKVFAETHGFTFPYLIDEMQEYARAYNAVCTPDFFGFNAKNELQYRGRLDDSGLEPANEGTQRELLEAMRLIGETGHGPRDQIASMGCSIKWRNNVD